MTIFDVALSLANVILNTTVLGNVGDCSCTVNSTHYSMRVDADIILRYGGIFSDNNLGSKRGSSGKSGTNPRMSMAKRLSLAAARRESQAVPVGSGSRYCNFRIYAFSPTSDSETGFRQSYARWLNIQLSFVLIRCHQVICSCTLNYTI